MAALTTNEKTKVRNRIEKIANEQGIAVRWVKAAMNDAAQAVENELVASKPGISSAIDTASSPYGITFTNQEKKWIGALVMEAAFIRDYLP